MAKRSILADGEETIRLDALCCNKPAHKLYEKCGFVKRGNKMIVETLIYDAFSEVTGRGNPA